MENHEYVILLIPRDYRPSIMETHRLVKGEETLWTGTEAECLFRKLKLENQKKSWE